MSKGLVANSELAKLGLVVESRVSDSISSRVKSNVAISAAITAYARIHMNQFKIEGETFYTDTDSIFTNTPLDSNLVGNELGQMKDELNGNVINDA